MSLSTAALSILLLTTLVVAYDTSLGTSVYNKIPPSVELIWHPCGTTYFCAVLDVPLDYKADCQTSRAYVPLIKLAAKCESPDGPYKGMVMVNPGGPGSSGIDFVLSDGASLSKVIGTNYDIVSFDPRGLWRSLPSANCTLPAAVRRQLPKLHAPPFLDSVFEEAFTSAKEIGAACQAQIGGEDQAGPHMTTATNARDMISIVDAYARSEYAEGAENPTLVNFWGFSYGSFIGEMLASLFPHRIGRVVLDGVLDPESFAIGTNYNPVVHTDEVIATFFEYCQQAGPTKCPFATGDSAKALVKRFERMILQLNPKHAKDKKWANATNIETALEGFKSAMFSSAYRPIESFPLAGENLPILEKLLNNGSLNAFVQALSDLVSPDFTEDNTIAYARGVSCTDLNRLDYIKTFEDLRAEIYSLQEQSAVAGDIIAEGVIECVGWSIVSDDRYPGPFGGNTLNPILFVSNTLDPITPIENSIKWTKAYKDAQLLTIEAAGHTSLAVENSCANAKIRDFFQAGELPVGDSVCALEAGPYGIVLPRGLEGRSDFRETRDVVRRLFGGNTVG